jgi:hypothetical protein
MGSAVHIRSPLPGYLGWLITPRPAVNRHAFTGAGEATPWAAQAPAQAAMAEKY